MHYDVVVIGGGPGGSTFGSLVKRYGPEVSVLILEREVFPRDHVGESQLPAVSQVLYEMGCWDKVEAANFPIKIGATYSWGKTKELWDFDFMPVQFALNLERPGTFDGARRHLAFQVDRAVYDDILLKHAAELGCEVRHQARVVKVNRTGDRVDSLSVEGLGEVTATTYIDASGHSGILRRAFEVDVEHPSSLQNVAVWDYWRNAEWADQIGVGGTRVQVMSLGYGWIWFIPLGPDRTSVGLVVPVNYFKQSKLSLPELYKRAILEQPRIASLMTAASSEGRLETTKDWSFIAKRQCGENWFLVGESSGFADPILAAGLTMTHAAAREAAFTVLEERQGGDPAKLRTAYEQRQIRRIHSHIRFADYWYTANSQFTDLKEFTALIAKENGLELSPEKAWAWLAQGGFIDEDLGAGVATFALPALRDLGDFIGETQGSLFVEGTNSFRVQLEGAKKETRMGYRRGRVRELPCYTRDGKMWPLEGRFGVWFRLLSQELSRQEMDLEIRAHAETLFPRDPRSQSQEGYQFKLALEALIADGWIEAWLDPSAPALVEHRGTKTIREHMPINQRKI